MAVIISVLAACAARPVAPAMQPAPAPDSARQPLLDEARALATKVHRIDDTHFQVDRLIVDQVRGVGPAALLGARLRASPDGITLDALDPTSLLVALGLANGDTVHAISHTSIRSVDDAWGIIQATASSGSNRVDVGITRGGAALTFHYALVADPGVVQPQPPEPVDDAATDAIFRAYDRGDYEDAMAHGLAMLADHPGDVRLLRVVVSAACQLGDVDQARASWAQLPPHDQAQMERRCARFGITLAP